MRRITELERAQERHEMAVMTRVIWRVLGALVALACLLGALGCGGAEAPAEARDGGVPGLVELGDGYCRRPSGEIWYCGPVRLGEPLELDAGVVDGGGS